MPKISEFASASNELLVGTSLIEAGAGTGKTYAISMLVLRFVVEKNLKIQQILLLTYTKAATQQLKDRVRKKLFEAKQTLTDQDEADAEISQWLQGLALAKSEIGKRLDDALADIDQASIFTIHGFCQRLLAEYALESGQLFDVQLSENINAAKQRCSDDFWRQQTAKLSLQQTAILHGKYPTPDDLLASVSHVIFDAKIAPPPADLQEILAKTQQIIASNKSAMLATLQNINQSAQDKFNVSFAKKHAENSPTIIANLAQKTPTIPDFASYSPENLLAGLNGNKFKKSKQNPDPPDKQKTNYLQAQGINGAPFGEVQDAIDACVLAQRRDLVEYLHSKLDQYLHDANILSFDQLISRTATALRVKGKVLSDKVGQNYSAALVDEFQDTDINQWFIIQKLFGSGSQYLYLIGDPKQAIYKFRGADINCYFAAKKTAQHHFTLSHNWRSHPDLVAAVNCLFAKKHAFASKDLLFNPAKSALKASNGEVQHNGQKIAAMVLWQLPAKQAKINDAIYAGLVGEIIALLQGDYTIKNDEENRAIVANDIAVLVRSNAQAVGLNRALTGAGVNSVITCRLSVFHTDGAKQMYAVLKAVAEPGNGGLARQALAMEWFGLGGVKLLEFINDDRKYSDWLGRLQQYRQLWQTRGLLAMLGGIYEGENVQHNLAKSDDAERKITNLQHLGQLLQQEVLDQHLTISKTCTWLQNKIAATDETTENAQLRLSSDDNAVQIATMHSAKGLEFGVVFCPFLWQAPQKPNDKVSNCYENGQMISDLGGSEFAKHQQLAAEEEKAESLRLFYVAVTRAKYRCYINWTEQRSANSAMAYLLDLPSDFDKGQQVLQSFSEDADIFAYKILQQAPPAQYQKPTVSGKLAARTSRNKYRSWQMSSYSGIVHSTTAAELPTDKAQEPQTLFAQLDVPPALPLGAASGNVLHELLEKIEFASLAAQEDITNQAAVACRYYGLPDNLAKQFGELLARTVCTKLGTAAGDFSLQELGDGQTIKEMAFYLPVRSFSTDNINKVLKNYPAYQPLSAKTISGYLTGAIDLVCVFADKYFVVDYKSNYLPDYSQATITRAMRQHNYGLQYLIYSVVLHRYLQNRLANYNYQTHFGGVRYLFSRGMDTNQPGSGVYQSKPDFLLINKLLTAFGI